MGSVEVVERYLGQLRPTLAAGGGTALFLDADPGSYEGMRRVLRHRSLQATTAFYEGGQAVESLNR